MNAYERSIDTQASQRGEEGTRTALLRAARDLFARRGYDGASIRAITRRADANLGSVTYHFGSKEELYHAVLEEVMAPLAARVSKVTAGAGPGVDRIERVVHAFFDHLRHHPELPQFMLQEIAAGKAPPPPVDALLRSVSGDLTRVVSEGQSDGEIRDGDPLLMGLSSIIQPVHLTLVRHWLTTMTGIDPEDPAQHDRLVEHAAAFVRAGLTPPQEESP